MVFPYKVILCSNLQGNDPTNLGKLKQKHMRKETRFKTVQIICSRFLLMGKEEIFTHFAYAGIKYFWKNILKSTIILVDTGE